MGLIVAQNRKSHIGAGNNLRLRIAPKSRTCPQRPPGASPPIRPLESYSEPETEALFFMPKKPKRSANAGGRNHQIRAT